MNLWKNLVAALVFGLALMGSVQASEVVNINTADIATLDRVLVGVGPSKAEAIVEYRKTHGPFRSADQLAKVKGIGLATVEKNRDRITTGNSSASSKKPMAGTSSGF